MPWQLKAMKDVVTCDKLRGAGKQASIPEMSEWENPIYISILFYSEFIGIEGKPRELKHLST